MFVPRLNGEKYFIMGNHDACHPCHKKKTEAAVELYQSVGLKMIGLEALIEIAAKKYAFIICRTGLAAWRKDMLKNQNI